MERNSTESGTTDVSGVVADEQISFDDRWNWHLSQYIQQHPNSPNTQLFSVLALLNAYVPDSSLPMQECQDFLGPPDPIHGGPPFNQRMEPFTELIDTSENVRIHPVIAQKVVDRLADSGVTQSTTAKRLMYFLCRHQPQPDIVQHIKDLLTKREMGEMGKEEFSRLITHIFEEETLGHAVSVLKTASDKFRQNPNFPQTISRLYHKIDKNGSDEAEIWAKRAIERAPKNSYVADTLGQVYKGRVIACQVQNILHCATEALQAFKDVENKAEQEEGPERHDIADTVSMSDNFNNRGLFGFIEVANTVFEKLGNDYASVQINLKEEVEAKFEFFEWYLTYSRLDMTSLEPKFFWEDVAECYKHYTGQTAAESTSFPGLLDRLNQGRFISKGRRAGFEEAEITADALQSIRDTLRTSQEKNADDVKVAERYILSNIILSNKMPNPPQPTLVELRAIIFQLLNTEVGRRSPEFYLLVLMLFWPEERATQEPGLVINIDLQRYVTFMEDAFERVGYAKYLRGRYLLPLFFLGKGSGLSKWIHKSRLDAIVEEQVDTDLAAKRDRRTKEKMKRISDMWCRGEVWQIPQVQEILLPVRVEPSTNPREVFVYVGGKKIKAITEAKPDGSALRRVLYYLGFTIQGPVVFEVDNDDDDDYQ